MSSTTRAPRSAATTRGAGRPHFTAPGLSSTEGVAVARALQQRLDALNDLALTLKHVHWNVVGPHFIGVHTMLDPQVDAVRLMVDATAERIALLGVAPSGTAGALVKNRSWDDYAVGRAPVEEHLQALDAVYAGVIGSHRQAIEELEELDLVSQDLLIGQVQQLEVFQWFVRAHREDSAGRLETTAE